MMHQFRGGAPPRGEAPSGYIVDISKDDETGGEASTRAIVNRDNGARGVGEAPAARPSPFGGGFPGLGGLFPPGLGLAVSPHSVKNNNPSLEALPFWWGIPGPRRALPSRPGVSCESIG